MGIWAERKSEKIEGEADYIRIFLEGPCFNIYAGDFATAVIERPEPNIRNVASFKLVGPTRKYDFFSENPIYSDGHRTFSIMFDGKATYEVRTLNIPTEFGCDKEVIIYPPERRKKKRKKRAKIPKNICKPIRISKKELEYEYVYTELIYCTDCDCVKRYLPTWDCEKYGLPEGWIVMDPEKAEEWKGKELLEEGYTYGYLSPVYLYNPKTGEIQELWGEGWCKGNKAWLYIEIYGR